MENFSIKRDKLAINCQRYFCFCFTKTKIGKISVLRLPWFLFLYLKNRKRRNRLSLDKVNPLCYHIAKFMNLKNTMRRNGTQCPLQREIDWWKILRKAYSSPLQVAAGKDYLQDSQVVVDGSLRNQAGSKCCAKLSWLSCFQEEYLVTEAVAIRGKINLGGTAENCLFRPNQ